MRAGQFLQTLPLILLQFHNSRSNDTEAHTPASHFYNTVLYLLFKNLSYCLLSLLILSAYTDACGCKAQKFATCQVKTFFILTVNSFQNTLPKLGFMKCLVWYSYWRASIDKLQGSCKGTVREQKKPFSCTDTNVAKNPRCFPPCRFPYSESYDRSHYSFLFMLNLYSTT